MKIKYKLNGGMNVEKDNISVELSKDKKFDIEDFLKQYDIKLNDVKGNTKVTLDEALKKVKNYQDPSDFIRLLKLVIEQDNVKHQKLVRENTKLKRIIRELEEEQDEIIEVVNNDDINVINNTISNDVIDVNKISFIISEIDKAAVVMITSNNNIIKEILSEYLTNLVGSFPNVDTNAVMKLKNIFQQDLDVHIFTTKLKEELLKIIDKLDKDKLINTFRITYINEKINELHNVIKNAMQNFDINNINMNIIKYFGELLGKGKELIDDYEKLDSDIKIRILPSNIEALKNIIGKLELTLNESLNKLMNSPKPNFQINSINDFNIDPAPKPKPNFQINSINDFFK